MAEGGEVEDLGDEHTESIERMMQGVRLEHSQSRTRVDGDGTRRKKVDHGQSVHDHGPSQRPGPAPSGQAMPQAGYGPHPYSHPDYGHWYARGFPPPPQWYGCPPMPTSFHPTGPPPVFPNRGPYTEPQYPRASSGQRSRVPPRPRFVDSDSDEDLVGRERVPVLRPRTFDGTSPWLDFKAHFESVARGNHWSAASKASQLRYALRGDAEAAVNSIQGVEFWPYRRLVQELEEIYGPRSNEATRLCVELRQRKRKAGESLQNLATDIRRGVNIVYAHKSLADRELDAVEIFQYALHNSRIVEKIMEKQPRTLHDALTIARRIETLQEAAEEIVSVSQSKTEKKGRANKTRGEVKTKTGEGALDEIKQLKEQVKVLTAELQKNKTVSKVQDSTNTETVCLNCKEIGHLFKDCQAPKSCFACGDPSHRAEDCGKRQLCHKCGRRGHVSEKCLCCERCGLRGHSAAKCRAWEKVCENLGLNK